MLDRRATSSRPGNRTDGGKLGLAIEGGGIRGVVSAAMLCALEEMGFADVFDEIYSCSSGAINAAYFLNGRTWFPLTIYFDDLLNSDFLDYRRLLRGLPPMNLDYVFDQVLVHAKPLNYQAILDSARPLHIMVTNVDELAAVDVAEFHDVDDLEAALRATTWLPLATRGTTTFRGFRALDGGVVRFHPFRAAEDDGCTHILSLSTRPTAPQRETHSIFNRFTARHLDRMRHGLGQSYLNCMHEYRTIDRPRLVAARDDLTAQPSLLDIAPEPETPEVGRDELDYKKVIAGASAAVQSAYAVLEQRRIQTAIRFDIV